MIVFALSVLFFVAIGITIIVRRKEIADGMAMFFGATTPPGCAVAMGLVFFGVAIAAVVLYLVGLLGPF